MTAPRTTRSNPSSTIANQQSQTGHWERTVVPAWVPEGVGRTVDMENLGNAQGGPESSITVPRGA
ncbi:hypothetical protein GCM10012320_18670 [Sinomonas cellulolyticus]|nr:hypothetical protein GCM10012320_18670 [Sinomonas sp. KCTC 49339]